MAEELPDECCAKCRFWREPTEDEITKYGEGVLGECYRYPPTMLMVDGRAESWYPDTGDDEWCGEYQPDPPQEVRRLDEPVQITATASTPPMSTTPPLWSPSPAPVYGPGFGPKDDNNKAWPEHWGK